MKKRGKVIGIFIVLFCLVLILGVMFQSPKITGNVVKENSEEININYDNFAEVLSENKIVKDLPKKAIFLFSEYGNSNSSKKYLIEKSKITEIKEIEESEKISEVDFEVSINSKYLDELTNNNYCGILSEVIDNDDFRVDLYKGKWGLFWKYKRMIKYKDCFGV